MLSEVFSESAKSFHEDMIKITDRLPTEEEYRRVRHLLLQHTQETISDEELARVLSLCPHLETVTLSGIAETTDRTVVVLAENAINLLGINLSGCTQVTDVGVLEITNKSLPLQWIQLNRVVGLTDPSISAIAKTCSRLIELEICDLPLLTPAAVRDIWLFSRYKSLCRYFHFHADVISRFPGNYGLFGWQTTHYSMTGLFLRLKMQFLTTQAVTRNHCRIGP